MKQQGHVTLSTELQSTELTLNYLAASTLGIFLGFDKNLFKKNRLASEA